MCTICAAKCKSCQWRRVDMTVLEATHRKGLALPREQTVCTEHCCSCPTYCQLPLCNLHITVQFDPKHRSEKKYLCALCKLAGQTNCRGGQKNLVWGVKNLVQRGQQIWPGGPNSGNLSRWILLPLQCHFFQL